MPSRFVASKALADMLSVLSHPARIRIVEELSGGECDVSTLQDSLGISHSGVSQHLALLRAHRLITERRDGRFVRYRLTTPMLAKWLSDGLELLSIELDSTSEIRDAVNSTLALRHKDKDKEKKDE